MPAVENRTPFTAKVFAGFDSHSRESLVLVVNGTFEAPVDGEPTAAGEQLSIEPVDRHYGDPATTSIRYPGQFAFAKSMTDVIVTGDALAPNGRPVETMLVGVRLGSIKKVLRVTGDRSWRRGVGSGTPSAPQPFVRMPIVYERAFGGGVSAPGSEGHAKGFERRNPVGIGLAGRLPMDPGIATEVPNIEYPSEQMNSMQQRPAPAGFGAIGPGWQPRFGFAGTYDESWLTEQAPLLPHDFDPRFFQVVPSDQQTQPVQAGDMVEVAGMTPQGHWTFQLPRFEVPVSLVHSDRIEHGTIVADTIHLEPNLYRLHLAGRLAIPVLRNRAPLAQIVVGAVRPGWLRSRYAGKSYRPSKGAEA